MPCIWLYWTSLWDLLLRTSTSRQDLDYLKALGHCNSASKYISKSGHLIISLFVLFEVLDERASVLKWIWLNLNERPPKFTKQSAVLTMECPASCRISCSSPVPGIDMDSRILAANQKTLVCWNLAGRDSSSEFFSAARSIEFRCEDRTRW
jgi:hypothetical protein